MNEQMPKESSPTPNQPEQLEERVKELNCLYSVSESLSRDKATLDEVLIEVARSLPAGWKYSNDCQARIICRNQVFQDDDFVETEWMQSAPIFQYGDQVGTIDIYYMKDFPAEDEGPFLKEERRLLDSIASHVGNALVRRSHSTIPGRVGGKLEDKDWRAVLDFLSRTDKKFYGRIVRKMVNYLVWSGVTESRHLLQRFAPDEDCKKTCLDENRPSEKRKLSDLRDLADEVFNFAAEQMTGDKIVSCIQQWIKEEKISFLKNALEDPSLSLTDLIATLDRFAQTGVKEIELSIAARRGLRVNLIRRFLTDQLEFINIAKQYLFTEDFEYLLARMIVPTCCHGQLGGKAAGLILANSILSKSPVHRELFDAIKTPSSWHIPSGGILAFISYNNLEDLFNQKYLETDEIRQEYPHIIQVFKNSHFPPEMVKGLKNALDNLGDVPLVIRSSSLLEDRIGAVFSGKYKSLFLANQGTAEERLVALMDAIAEIYASLFGPDPIEYRAERGLLDVREEMGILIQEVVGQQAGPYFLPAYAGVAFSHNEFRWSPRIEREDGLVRIVPGLGTRAVDRTSNDYPMLMAPGQPNLRVNVTADEVARYSPRFVDVINLEKRTFETVSLRHLLKVCKGAMPQMKKLISRLEGDRLTQPMPFQIDYDKDDLVCSFAGLNGSTQSVKTIGAVLQVLKDRLGYPVDIEFAHDGKNFYILQCRPQSYGPEIEASPIPRDVPEEKIIFTGNRYISNGLVPDITHLVYIDPQEYEQLGSLELLQATGRTVGLLNRMLPKRNFILMGPGRWGSRGDIKLGVNVTYSDINNTAALIEVGRQKKDYCPELSFGTHFFQDLVEAGIRYIPLYPDNEETRFNEDFINQSPNILLDLLPDKTELEKVIKVIDIPAVTDGHILRVLLNADLDEAMALLALPGPAMRVSPVPVMATENRSIEHWRWRQQVAEKLADELDGSHFGVKALYLFGSVKNANAGPGSDIDLLFHFVGNQQQRKELLLWLDGWSLCLGEMNTLRTGQKSGKLLDIHLVTDDDIARQTSFAAKIDAVTDAARLLRDF